MYNIFNIIQKNFILSLDGSKVKVLQTAELD